MASDLVDAQVPSVSGTEKSDEETLSGATRLPPPPIDTCAAAATTAIPSTSTFSASGPTAIASTSAMTMTNGGHASSSTSSFGPLNGGGGNGVRTNGYASMQRRAPGPGGGGCGGVATPNLYRREVLVPPAPDDPVDGSVSWQMFSVTLHRSPTVGFGIAISGGRDNPHFVSGDPAIVVSDVVASGPAAGLVQLNDRIVAANGVRLENSDYATAVSIMKDAHQLNMIVKRRVPVPFVEFEQRTLKFTLSKSRKKDDFGIVLGCKYYIKEITNPKLAEKDPGLKEGDVVLRVNGQSLDGVTLEEATRWLQRSRERLSLVVQRDVRRGTPGSRWSSQNTVYERLGSVSATPRHSPTPMHYTHSANPDLAATVRKMSADYLQGGGGNKRLSDPMARAFEYPPTSGGYVGTTAFPQPPRSPQYFHPGANGANGDPYCESPRPHPANRSSQTPSVCSSPRLYSTRRNEVRLVSFKKGHGSLGIRVIGGNHVGIFVSAVQDDSPAALHGIRVGDKLLAVNAYSMDRATREQAVEYLLALGDDVQLKIESAFEDFLAVRNNQLGDNFFIRTHFAYVPAPARRSSTMPMQLRELSFVEGDILRVTDTLFGGSVGQWKVQKLFSATGAEIKPHEELGIVPNGKTAETLAKQSRTESNTLGRSLFRKKLNSRRTKSLTTTVEDELAAGAAFDLPLPAYERVTLKQPTFARPIVLYGALADVAKQLLFAQFAFKFAGVNEDAGKPVPLSQVDAIMAAGKHCVLTVSPGSVERLHLAQYAPIVVMLDCESRSRVRDLRSKAGAATNSARKLIEHAQKIKKHHANLFTATLDLQKEEKWFDTLRQTIFTLQERRVWMPEIPPERPLHELLLFPMSACDADGDSLKGDYGTATQFEMRNQLYPQTTTGLGELGYSSNSVTPNDTLGRFPDDLNNLTLNNGASTYGSRNGNFYSAFARTAPRPYQPTSNYDPFCRTKANGNGNGSANVGAVCEGKGDCGTSSSTNPTYDETRSRLSASPYQTPIRHESRPKSPQTARSLFFERIAQSTRPQREISRTPESAADYRVAGLSADDRSTRSNYDPPFIDDLPSKSVNLDTDVSVADDISSSGGGGGTGARNQVKEHVSGLIDWTGGELQCPESGVTLVVPENAIPFGTQQHIYVEVCEEGPQNPPLALTEALLSPLVVCGPQGLQFQVPVQLRLPHNFTAGDPTAANVVLKAGQGSQWSNIELAQPPRTEPNGKFVSVLVKHF